jgi:hypothetical protein
MPRCLQGTRTAILNQVIDWVNFEDGDGFFWVHGSAGTGKSTISLTIARHFREDSNRLAASYFFKRGEKDRNGTTLFFSTLANELIKTMPMYKENLKASLDALGQDQVEEKGLEEQFKILVETPLGNIPPSSFALPKIIVIDALDECEEEINVPKICEYLCRLQTLTTVRLRVLITSRDDYSMVNAFKRLEKLNIKYQSLSLDRDFLDETKSDIRTFLDDEFASIRSNFSVEEDPWPDSQTLQKIVNLATSPSPLFIYAATLCRFLDDPTGRSDPVDSLETWFEDSKASQLDQTYMPILRRLLIGSEKDPRPLRKPDLQQLQLVLAAIIFLKNPLPASGLGGLLDLKPHSIARWLRNLNAVVNNSGPVDSPVQLFHKSFSDFVVGYKLDGVEFQITETEAHSLLASACIKRMANETNGLKQDMLQGKTRSDTISEIVPIDLQYACTFWVHHLDQSKQAVNDDGEAYVFFKKHFLHWLEVLSLTYNMSEGVIMMRELDKLLAVSVEVVNVVDQS